MGFAGHRAAFLRERRGSLESWHLMAWPAVKQMLQAMPALSRAQMRPFRSKGGTCLILPSSAGTYVRVYVCVWTCLSKKRVRELFVECYANAHQLSSVERMFRGFRPCCPGSQREVGVPRRFEFFKWIFFATLSTTSEVLAAPNSICTLSTAGESVYFSFWSKLSL